MPRSTQSFLSIGITLLGGAAIVKAHSWVEQLRVIAPNGTFVGEPGFPRGFVSRDDPNFSDVPMVHLVTGAPDDTICKESQQSASTQLEANPRLQAAPGDAVALRYQENGHVTLPETQPGKADNRGDVFVYGTTNPQEGALLNDIHGVWTADGQGGDGSGVLLAKASYDDGQCYQINGGAISNERQSEFPHEATEEMGADLWCQTDIRLPADAADGQPYTLYWVWEWPTVAGEDPGLPEGKNETYTSCMDIDITASSDISQKATSDGFIKDQPIENAAVPEQFDNLDADVTAGAAAADAPKQKEEESNAETSAAIAPAPAESAAEAATPVPSDGESSPGVFFELDDEPASASGAAPIPPAAPAVPAVPAADDAAAPPEAAPVPTTLVPIPSPSASLPEGNVVTVTDRTVVTETAVTTVSVPNETAAPAAVPKIRGRSPVI